MFFRNNDDDIHELLKQDIIPVKRPKESQIIDETEQFVILDSFAKLKTSATELGEYKWIFSTQGLSSDESIGILDPIDNVTEIQIGSFYMPILEDVTYLNEKMLSYTDIELVQNNTTPSASSPPTLIRNGVSYYGQYPYSILLPPADTYKIPWINNPYTQLPYCNRITIYIKESSLQSYCNIYNTRFNYEFVATFDTRLHNNPSFLQVNPINSSKWDSYRFVKPINNLNTMTLIFRNPDNTINFEPDVMYKSLINLTVDLFNPANNGLIFVTTQFVHKLYAGDRIYLRNFRPLKADSTFNDEFPEHITNYINRPDGHAINNVFPSIAADPSVPLFDGYSFGLDPALKLVNPTLPTIAVSFPSTVDVYIAKRRIRIPMRIKSLKKKRD
jgi:hypothetical protein